MDKPTDLQRLTTKELFDRAVEAATALRKRESEDKRLANGQFGPGSMANLQHGLRSDLLVDQPDIAAWHREQVGQIATDLGGDEELTTLMRANVREVARLEIILESLGQELLEKGVLTTDKRQIRHSTMVYLQVLDRFTRLSASLGLERRTKPVDPIINVQRAVAEANKK